MSSSDSERFASSTWSMSAVLRAGLFNVFTRDTAGVNSSFRDVDRSLHTYFVCRWPRSSAESEYMTNKDLRQTIQEVYKKHGSLGRNRCRVHVFASGHSMDASVDCPLAIVIE